MQLRTSRFHAMGTPCELLLYAADATAEDAVKVDVARLEAKYSRYRPDSYLSHINAVAAVGGAIEVDSETAQILDYACTCYTQSQGLFDLSSGLLRQAWNFKEPRLPRTRQLEELLARVGWDKVKWSSPHLEFQVAGMELDLGGVVKEYAADRAATLCMEHGVRHGLINLGGDIRVVGPHPDGSPWQIGIRDPRKPDRMLRSVALRQGALATSGDYERCFTLDGRRYGHILNPRTGWPVQGLAAVSVIADYCVVAGSAATIGMLKENAGKTWLVGLGLPHLWVDTQGKIGGSLIDESSQPQGSAQNGDAQGGTGT
jgi:Membrane-associated lipoprotein involved in thiamine biosynthesis